MSEQDAYWNHNTAYHPWILRVLRQRQRVLDVGCGDGLLVSRLAAVADRAVGLEPDPATAARARRRLAGTGNVDVVEQGLLEYRPAEPFDAVVFVASLHHLGLQVGIRRALDLLAPGGSLVVVGLARNATVVDWTRSLLSIPINKVAGWVQHERNEIGVPVAEPDESYADLRRFVRRELPGAHWRYGVHYRYLLRWTAPPGHEPRLG